MSISLGTRIKRSEGGDIALAAFKLGAERLSTHSKETGLVIYLAFLAKVANLYYILLTAFKKYWPDTVAKFISGTQDIFI